MIPTFTLPLGFLSLLAIPGLVAIYLLRTRSRRYPVSSLMLWVNQQQARQGGLRVERLQTSSAILFGVARYYTTRPRSGGSNHSDSARCDTTDGGAR